MRIRSFKFVLASVIAAVAVLFFIIRNVEKDDGVAYCSSTGVRSYTLKTLGDTLQIIENNLDNTLGYSMTMYRKGNGYYAKLLGKERLVMSLSDTVCRAKPNSGDITVLVHQETDTTFSSIITMQSGKDPRIMLRYDCKYRILTIGKLMLDEIFMPQ